MSIEFNNENQEQKAAQIYAQMQSSTQPSGIGQWLMNKGIVKTASQASAVLLSIAVVAFVITGVIIYNMNRPSSTEAPTPALIPGETPF